MDIYIIRKNACKIIYLFLINFKIEIDIKNEIFLNNKSLTYKRL